MFVCVCVCVHMCVSVSMHTCIHYLQEWDMDVGHDAGQTSPLLDGQVAAQFHHTLYLQFNNRTAVNNDWLG